MKLLTTNRNCSWQLAFIAALLFFAAAVGAQVQVYPMLVSAGNYQSVVQAWGVPDRQEKKGTSETWTYGSGRVVFEAGKVVAWTRPEPDRPVKSGKVRDAQQIKSVLEEILEE